MCKLGSPTEIIENALKLIADSDDSTRVLSHDVYDLVLLVLDREFGGSAENPECLSGLHPDKRIEMHYLLANYHQEKIQRHWITSHHEKALRHCQEALFLMQGRERLNAKKAATLNVWASGILLINRDPALVQKNIPVALKHLHEARVAMYAYTETNQELSYEICLLTAAAYSERAKEPVCDNLIRAYKAYNDADDMLRMGSFDAGLNWMRLGSLQLQIMLRFLSHRRKAQARKRSFCSQAEVALCMRKLDSTDCTADITPDATISRAEALRTRITRHFDVHPDDENSDVAPRQVLCAIHETIARAYLERAASERGKGLEDIRRARQNIDKAISACEWDDDFTGQKYASLRELADDTEAAIDDLESRPLPQTPTPEVSEEGEDNGINVELEE